MSEHRINRIGIVADLHCGSRFGLRHNPKLTDPYTTKSDIWLSECWKRMIKVWPELDLLILNGDLIDGTQRKSEGVGLITTNLDEQTEIAIQCLKPLVAKAKKVIRMRGTSYHESFQGPLSTLDVTFGINKPDRDKAFVRDIYLDGSPKNEKDAVVLNVKHNPEGQRTLYLGTTMDRETRWSVLSEAANAMPKSSFIVRSHIHFAADFTDYCQGKSIITTPCFCLQQPYATEKRYYGWQPTIGGLLLERDSLSYRGWKHLMKIFPLPPVIAESFSDL